MLCCAYAHSHVWLFVTPWTTYSPPGSSVRGIPQARILEWVAMPSSRGIFLTQGSNPGLPHWRQILYSLSHGGSPRILKGVPYPFSRGSSRPRNWTGVSCIIGRFFTSWATRKADLNWWTSNKVDHGMVDLIQSVEVLNRTKTALPWARRTSASWLPLDLSSNSCLGLKPANLLCRLWTYQVSKVPWANFLE